MITSAITVALVFALCAAVFWLGFLCGYDLGVSKVQDEETPL